MTKKNLPWKTKAADFEQHEVGHPDYGVLLIEKKGSLTPNEELEASNYFLNVGDRESLSQAKIEITTQLLRSRVDPTWTYEDTLSQIGSFSLIEDLYIFHSNERSRWVGKNYLVKTDGEQGYIAACDYAQKYNYLVAVRPDIPGNWFVFAERQQVPDGFSIVLDYTGESVSEDSPKKQQPQKLTGVESTGGSNVPTQEKKGSAPKTLVTNQSG